VQQLAISILLRISLSLPPHASLRHPSPRYVKDSTNSMGLRNQSNQIIVTHSIHDPFSAALREVGETTMWKGTRCGIRATYCRPNQLVMIAWKASIWFLKWRTENSMQHKLGDGRRNIRGNGHEQGQRLLPNFWGAGAVFTVRS